MLRLFHLQQLQGHFSPSPRRRRAGARTPGSIPDAASVLDTSAVSERVSADHLAGRLFGDAREAPEGEAEDDAADAVPGLEAARAAAEAAAEALPEHVSASVDSIFMAIKPIQMQVSAFTDAHPKPMAPLPSGSLIGSAVVAMPVAAATIAASNVASLARPLLDTEDRDVASEMAATLQSHSLLQNWSVTFFTDLRAYTADLALDRNDLLRASDVLDTVSDTILISETATERASKATRFLLRAIVLKILEDSPLVLEDQTLLVNLVYCDPNFFEPLNQSLEEAGKMTWPSYHHYKRFLQWVLNSNPEIGTALKSLTRQLFGDEWAAETDFTHSPLFEPLPTEACMFDGDGRCMVTVSNYKERRLQFPDPLYESFAETLFEACRFERFDSSSKMLDHMLGALREWLADCSEGGLPTDTTDNALVLLALLHQFQGETDAKKTIGLHMTAFLEEGRHLTDGHVHIHDATQALPTVLAALETRLRSQISSPLTYMQHNRLWTTNKLFQLGVLAFGIYELVAILQGKNTAFSDISLPILLGAAVLCSDLFDTWAHDTEVRRFMSAMNVLLHDRESTMSAFCSRNADEIKLGGSLLAVAILITTAIIADAEFDDPSVPTPTADEWGVAALTTQPLAGVAVGLAVSTSLTMFTKWLGREQPAQVTRGSAGASASWSRPRRPDTSLVLGGFGVGVGGELELTAAAGERPPRTPSPDEEPVV